jgi:CBS domain-containing protein
MKKISEIMTREVITIHPHDTIQTAAKKMRDYDIGFLPVYDGDKLVGVLSDRDIIIRALADGMDPKTRLNTALVTSPAIYCFEDQSIDDATDLMHDHQVRRLVILDRGNKQLAGVISLGDLALHVGDKTSGEVLQGVSVPSGELQRESGRY